MARMEHTADEDHLLAEALPVVVHEPVLAARIDLQEDLLGEILLRGLAVERSDARARVEAVPAQPAQHLVVIERERRGHARRRDRHAGSGNGDRRRRRFAASRENEK